MHKDPEYIDQLIVSFFSGQISVSEKEELVAWINASAENKEIFEKSKQLWEEGNAYLSSEMIRADREAIDRKIYELSVRRDKKRKLITLTYRVAAAIFIPLALALTWFWGYHSGNSITGSLCEVSAPRGHIAQCVLADGTQVWLNAGTTIKYTPALQGKNREIFLSGEAYFKVTKDEHKPFIVCTSETEIKVLGTSFNVKAYPGESSIEATLEEGRIELLLKRTAKMQAPIELKPGDHAIYSLSDKKVVIESGSDTEQLTAWRDGKFMFRDADLQTIITQLEKLYDVRIHLANENIARLRFRGVFEYEQNIFDALETIQRTTSLTYRINGRDIWIE